MAEYRRVDVWRWACAVDDACVAMMEETSWRSPRDFLRDCAHCGMPFWVHPGGGSWRRWCSPNCNALAFYARNEAYREGSKRRARAQYWRGKEKAA